MRLVSFASGSDQYFFPTLQTAFATNFANAVPATIRLPGLSGGFDSFGNDPAPGEIGYVKTTFLLRVTSRASMEAQRDALKMLQTLGTQRLLAQPSDPNALTRWCYAKVQNVQIDERPDLNTDLWQYATVNFHVPYPRWFSQGTESPTWGGFKWHDGTRWGGASTPTPCADLKTDVTLSVGGTAPAHPRVTISTSAGQTANNPRIQRIVNGAIVDDVTWNGVLTNGDSLEIDTRTLSVTKNGVDAYSTSFTFTQPNWLTLRPGSNQIRVLLGSSVNHCSIFFRYYEEYY